MNGFAFAYDILAKIYKEDAFSSIELNKRVTGASNQAVVTRLVYGVLQKDTELEYYISKFTQKRPNKSVAVLLKEAMYCLLYMDSFPDYAVVDESVELCQKIGKRQLKGFVNGVLKNFIAAGKKAELPKDRDERLSITVSVPLWLVRAYIRQYGFEKTQEFLNVEEFTKEHIRNNSRLWTTAQLKSALDEKNISYVQSSAGGLFVDNSAYIKELSAQGKITYQSMTSMLAVQALEVKDGEKMLDLCAAPGGKSVYASELADIEITSCDIYEHRLELIKAYADRMKEKSINVMLNDATQYNDAFYCSFDKVLCDVPCSGLGVAGKKPDIYLRSSMQKVLELSEVQYKILSNASKYVKPQGRLVYSTCTTLREENYNVVGKFVKDNQSWRVLRHENFLPDGKGCDGFFIAVLERK